MAVITVSLRIPEDLWTRVIQFAEDHQSEPDEIVYTAIEQFFELTDEDRAAVEEGIRQADAGELIDHEEVVAWLESQKPRASAA